MTDPNALQDVLRDAPRNWGRWGEDDEVGALNFLTNVDVLKAVRAVRQGKAFTLQARLCDPAGDPMSRVRPQPMRFSVIDRSDYLVGKGREFAGGLQVTDDYISMYLHGTTHCDALGHAWCGETIYNGKDAASTIGRLEHASVLALAERGIVARGVLLDVARHRGKRVLDDGEGVTHEDLMACAEAQGVEIRKRDVLLIRAGIVGRLYEEGPLAFYDDFREAGLVYSPELVHWFHEMEIPSIVADTTAAELGREPTTGAKYPLHVALLSNLGICLTEIAWLDPLADDCAGDGQWDFLYVAAPLKVVGASGAPVNPVAIK